jgi:hypothetical protein
VNKGAPNQNNASQSNQSFENADAEHSAGPVSHALLGIEVAFLALGFFGGWLLLICGIQRVGNAVDIVLDGNRQAWWSVGLWYCLSAVGGAMAAGAVTYGLSITM